MAARGKNIVFGAIGLSLVGLAVLPQQAAAQNIFERIFGGIRRAIEPPRAQPAAFADPFSSMVREMVEPGTQRADVNPSKGFCVRTCDGHFFPVQARPGMSAAESCHSFCPAAETQIFSGSHIDSAVASDGSRYADLDNAFLYRKQLVAGCSCTGRGQFGLVPVDVNTDPTLRPGDVVATKTGLMAFTGATDKVANFTPIDSYRGIPKNTRDKLSDVKIAPPTPVATVPPEAAAQAADKTRAAGRKVQR